MCVVANAHGLRQDVGVDLGNPSPHGHQTSREPLPCDHQCQTPTTAPPDAYTHYTTPFSRPGAILLEIVYLKRSNYRSVLLVGKKVWGWVVFIQFAATFCRSRGGATGGGGLS